ncbi:hypothetical protein WJX72_006370 [[Myrmecia] bisecta]|uniref:F-box domain-containing protein n=1 Tax=[Myrmecia] bisecta TaxID=41462 RepID=A0AAW1P2U5_9CHLO
MGRSGPRKASAMSDKPAKRAAAKRRKCGAGPAGPLDQLQGQSAWPNLPHDIFKDISSRLCLWDFATMRLVCQGWRETSYQTADAFSPDKTGRCIGMQQALKFPMLHKLTLSPTSQQTSWASLTKLSALSYLTALRLAGSAAATAKQVSSLTTILPRLRTISFDRGSLSKSSLARLVGLSGHLTSLHLTVSYVLDDGAMHTLAALTELRVLRLAVTGLSDAVQHTHGAEEPFPAAKLCQLGVPARQRSPATGGCYRAPGPGPGLLYRRSHTQVLRSAGHAHPADVA